MLKKIRSAVDQLIDDAIEVQEWIMRDETCMDGKFTKVNIALSYVKELVDRVTPLIGCRLSLRTEKPDDKSTK